MGDWYASARKIERWGTPTFQALDRLEQRLAEPQSPARDLDETRQAVEGLLFSAQAAVKRVLDAAGDAR